MRPTDYTSRQQLQPGRIKNKSRYVTASIYSHSRPVDPPMSKEGVDAPESRGLTIDNESK